MKTILVLAVLVLAAGCVEANIAGRDNGGAGTGPTAGLPGDRCAADDDCLSRDCNDSTGVCR